MNARAHSTLGGIRLRVTPFLTTCGPTYMNVPFPFLTINQTKGVSALTWHSHPWDSCQAVRLPFRSASK